jgi:23S rRNA pseudouridine2605 synthase
VRVNQYVAQATGVARRAADTLVAAGRVKINDSPAVPGSQVESSDTVMLDNRTLTLPTEYTYVLLHKPVGYVTSRARQGTDPTIYSLLPEKFHALVPAGRLDRDSSGLLLLSDDGPYIHRLTHPKFTKRKVYELTLTKPLDGAAITKLQQGVELDDGISHLTIEHARGRRVAVSLTEGRNRQIRRTFGALGYTIDTLHRTEFGSYQLGRLPPGQWRLTAKEARA